jgi:hypothetical protein
LKFIKDLYGGKKKREQFPQPTEGSSQIKRSDCEIYAKEEKSDNYKRDNVDFGENANKRPMRIGVSTRMKNLD